MNGVKITEIIMLVYRHKNLKIKVVRVYHVLGRALVGIARIHPCKAPNLLRA